MTSLRSWTIAAVLALATSAGAQAVGDGYWHTSGNKILDAAGGQVRFSGVNFGGFESENYALHGTWGGIGRNWKTYLDQIQSTGFNLIRLPFSGDIFAPGRMPLNIDYGVNADLQGKTTMQFLDLFVAECGSRGIRIILDYHRIQAGGTPENGLWYIPGSGTYTEAFWINNWKALVARYLGNPTVVGCDLFNEVHAGGTHPGPFWSADGTNEPYNWRTAAKRCAEAILSVNPELLLCVQGMDGYNGQGSWWGANLMGLKDHPFNISKPGQVVYEVHDYGPNVWQQPWHTDPNFPNNLPGFWDGQWGFVHDQNIGPIWIGEWGTKWDIQKEKDWATALRNYIQTKGLSWTWWTWGPNSGDTGGILKDDWTTAWAEKLTLLGPVQYPGFATSGGGAAPPPPPPPGTTPHGGTARAIPGMVEAEDFDDGAEGVAYHDSDATNQGGQYRTTGVDIEASLDTTGGYDVGYFAPGEWLIYTVDVGTSGTYSLDSRVASAMSGTFHVEFGGTDVTGPIPAAGTGGWQTWTTVTTPGLTLAAGLQSMKIVFDSGSFNLNKVTFMLTAAGPGGGSPPPGGGGSGSGSGGGGGGGGHHCGGSISGAGGPGTAALGALVLGFLLGLSRRRGEGL